MMAMYIKPWEVVEAGSDSIWVCADAFVLDVYVPKSSGVGDSPILGLVLFITVSCKHGDGEPLASGDIQR